MSELETIIKNLESNNDVDAAFLAGSFVNDKRPYSDIDLIIILKKNVECIKSVFTWIDGIFADIFFFDLENIDNTMNANWSPAISHERKHLMNSLLIHWLKEGAVQFDKSGKLTELKSKEVNLNKVGKGIKEWCWLEINYSLETNNRYFNSNDPIYQEALEMRLLLRSIPQLIEGYFAFRDIPWRGEKNAVKYFKEKDSVFYSKFLGFSKSSLLKDRFEYYKQMVDLIFTSDYSLWSKGGVYPKRNDDTNDSRLIKYWKNLIS